MTCTTIVSDFVMSIIKELEVASRIYRVSHVDMYTINADGGYLEGIVDFQSPTCTCMDFNCLDILCSHVISVAALRNINI